MKHNFSLFIIAAIALLAAACQRYTPDYYAGSDAVDVTLSIDVPELAHTRSGETGMNSALGAIDNFEAAGLWDKFDVRYILEVYDVSAGYGDGINGREPILARDRDVNILDEYDATTFDFRLIPGRDYKFILWADFVANGSYAKSDEEQLAVADLNYNTTDLRNITRNAWTAMDECQDAYFFQHTFTIDGPLKTNIELKRPFGKLRVVTTDIEELNLGSVPSKVVVEFENCKAFGSFDAFTGKVLGTAANTYTYTIAKDAPYSEGLDKESTHQTLFSDYLFAEDQQNDVSFDIYVYESVNGADRIIREHEFTTQIPVQRNHLTTIIGNLLTTASQVAVTIDDDFVDPEYIRTAWSGEYEALPAAGTDGYITITTPGQFATLITSDIKGKKVRLGANIDLGGYTINPSKYLFSGDNTAFILDGAGYTVTNFIASPAGENGGLFTTLVNATVKDLTITNASVCPSTRGAGDYYAGMLAGSTMGYCHIEGVKVIGCEVVGNNKVGGLIGNVAENDPITIKGCVVSDTKVSTTNTADGGCVGGLVGYIVPNATVEQCHVEKTTIEAINSRNNAERANAEFIGTFHGNGKTLTLNGNTLADNTFTQAPTSYVAPTNFGAWLGGVRFADGSKVILDGKNLMEKEKVALATPQCTVNYKGVYGEYTIHPSISWTEVDNAVAYRLVIDGVEHVLTDLTYIYNGNWGDNVAFSITAVAEEDGDYRESAAYESNISIVDTQALSKPSVSSPLATDGKTINIYWEPKANTEKYIIYVNGEEKAVLGQSDNTIKYDFIGKFDSTYEIKVLALNDTDGYESNVSNPITVNTRHYIYLNPNMWKADSPRFMVWTWADNGEGHWVEMADSNDDGIYEVEKSLLSENLSFVRMNPAGNIDWNNKWNQTGNLTLPTNGNNLFTPSDWNGATSTWSKKQQEVE